MIGMDDILIIWDKPSSGTSAGREELCVFGSWLRLKPITRATPAADNMTDKEKRQGRRMMARKHVALHRRFSAQLVGTVSGKNSNGTTGFLFIPYRSSVATCVYLGWMRRYLDNEEDLETDPGNN